MGLVFFLAAALWVGGIFLKVSSRLRWVAIGLLYVGVLGVQLAFPMGHNLRMMTGGSAALWFLVGGLFAVFMLYRRGLQWLKARAQPNGTVVAPAQTGVFSEKELDRYARHIVLHEIGGLGQKRLKNARVLVIGAGGLGSPVLLYLAAAGVGTIGVIDDDVVDNSNLQRQVIHSDDEIGTPKVKSAMLAMVAQNPNVQVLPYQKRLTADIASDLIADFDLVLDGTDNFETRYLVNTTCVALGKPLISGALSQWEGQISVFDPKNDAPCYQCVFPKAPAAGLAPSCSEAGVVGPLPGVIGAMMAVEAVKVIAKAGAPLRGDMLIYDALYGETRKIGVKRRVDCPVCGSKERATS